LALCVVEHCNTVVIKPTMAENMPEKMFINYDARVELVEQFATARDCFDPVKHTADHYSSIQLEDKAVQQLIHSHNGTTRHICLCSRDTSDL